MSARAARIATYADVLAAPDHMVAEIVRGALHTQPRPSPRHSTSAIRLGASLTGPFDFGRGGPGGWVFASEPELHLGVDIVVPDIAGWRRERLPTLPEEAYFTLAPDWVCEILSSSTARLDRGPKRAIYAEAGMPYLWLLDPDARLLEAFALEARGWLLVGVVSGDAEVRLPPFDAAGFPLSDLFPFDPPPQADDAPRG